MSVTISSSLAEIKAYVVECVLRVHRNASEAEIQAIWDEGVERNGHIIELLSKLSREYQTQGDRWRAIAYRQAVSSIKQHGIPIVSGAVAIKLPKVGKSIASKIDEFLATGTLTKFAEMGDRETVLKRFVGIWGAGPIQATKWYNFGYRTLDQLRSPPPELPNPGLTDQQELGLKYYDDLVQRIPRDEVTKAFEILKRAIHTVDKDLRVEIGGSYRRGEATSGDIDLLVLDYKDKVFMTDIVKALKDVIEATLTSGPDRYIGIIKVNGKFRKLDVILIPSSEWAAGLMYFTGSLLFNVRLRGLAKAKGLRLNQHGLYDAETGLKIPTETEEDIFKALGEKYLSPEERSE